jgi:hypothetical protein
VAGRANRVLAGQAKLAQVGRQEKERESWKAPELMEFDSLTGLGTTEWTCNLGPVSRHKSCLVLLGFHSGMGFVVHKILARMRHGKASGHGALGSPLPILVLLAVLALVLSVISGRVPNGLRGASPALAAARAAATADTTAVSVPPTLQSGPYSIVHRVQDTYIDNVDTSDHSGGAFLHIGTPDGGTTKYRSFLQFDVSALAGATIQSATLRLYNSYTGSCSGWWMYAYPVTRSWSQSTITWANQPGVNTSPGYSAAADFGVGNTAAGCPDHPNFINPDASDGIHRLDVTGMVSGWVSGALPNHGLRLSAGELGTQAYKDFCSMNPDPPSTTNPCTIAYNTPTLEITYNTNDPVTAVVNGATKSVEFYDAANPSRWISTGPFQSWAPDAYHSITDTTLVPPGTWGGGVDVKLRPAGAYGGGRALVAADTNSGFVGVIPYPALSGRYWAINVGSPSVSSVHGAELLPDGNVAVALAVAGRVQVYSRAQGQNWAGSSHTPVADVALPGAHEVLYDPAANALWAIGGAELVEYPYTAGSGALGTPVVYDLPPQTKVSPATPAYGHDVQPVYGDPGRLWIGANAGVTQFSKTGTASCAVAAMPTGWPDPASPGAGTRWCDDYQGAAFIDAHNLVKSIGDNPGSGQVAETWPDPAAGAPSWTTPEVTFFSTAGTVSGSSSATAQYYRARWMVAAYQ